MRPITIEYSLVVIEEIRREVSDGFQKLSQGAGSKSAAPCMGRGRVGKYTIILAIRSDFLRTRPGAVISAIRQ